MESCFAYAVKNRVLFFLPVLFFFLLNPRKLYFVKLFFKAESAKKLLEKTFFL